MKCRLTMTQVLLSGTMIFGALSASSVVAEESPATPTAPKTPLQLFPFCNASIGTPIYIQYEGKKVEVAPPMLRPMVFPGNPKAATLSERTDRNGFTSGDFQSQDGKLTLCLNVYAENTIPYVRHELLVRSNNEPCMIERVTFADHVPVKNMAISGNTDGPVAVYDGTTYFGIEHPMAKVSVKEPTTGLTWSPDDFAQGEQVVTIQPIEAGNLTVAFAFKNGSHRLDIEEVRLVDAQGNIASQDVHQGFSGTQKSKNEYKLKVPMAGKYTLKCIYKKTNQTNSNGEITLRGVQFKDTLGKSQHLDAFLKLNYVLNPGETWTFSSVVGRATSKDQLRRDFQEYLNRERAHPYRVFPHYNSWYDLCISYNDNKDPLKRMTEEKALKSMRTFNEELFKKRGVHIESYLLDDGWDDWDTLWGYHVGFPNKFDLIYKEVKSQNSGISAWLSPWGGYGGSKGRRVANAKRMGLETPNGGLSLSQPRYYNAFRDRCLQMVNDYNMNMFKFDGIGAGTFATGAPDNVAKDLAGFVRLIQDLRAAKQDLFINCTVGTWASPFWLHYADAIWRGGNDCEYRGPGTKRAQWVTYRDDVIYERFVKSAPLFPLNSIMSHGIIVGNRSVPSAMKIGDDAQSTTDFANEVWMAVACGTDLQEYYISPDLMSQKWWDILADGIKWLRRNESTLRDAHWAGGSPARGEVYGFASFAGKKGVLILRNPAKEPRTFTGTLTQIFEMPQSAKVSKIVPVYSSSVKITDLIKSKASDDAIQIELPPFEVMLFEVEFQ